MSSNGQNGTNPWIEDPIAIVGIGLRLPGSIRTSQQYWDFLKSKRSGRGRVPANRYNADAFVGPKGKARHSCTEYGYFLEDTDLATIDTSFWSMSKKELEAMDPQQRLILEVVYECLENSGATGYKGQKIGCYVGVYGEDWADLQTKDPHATGMYQLTGYGDFTIANRVSYELGLTGPSMTVRTACSSSLTALHQACQDLYSGECSAAVIGGCSLILSPHATIAMTEQGVLSATGYCHSFDAAADGYARGEGVNAIYIKRLSTALRDGDNIRAVIRSVCINSDGKTSGLSVPNSESHADLMRRGHSLAGITDLSKTAMIECHGTGTPVGDPLETGAVAQVFGEWGILIGSVKSNLGHGEGASGLSSVIKMVLSLENQTILPNINFETPNPKIPFVSARLRVPVECEPWPSDRHELVGVNSFGIGGANAHVLLESARSFVKSTVNDIVHEKSPTQLLVFSATHPQTVEKGLANVIEYLSVNDSQTADTSYTLACRRSRLPHRAFAIGSTKSWDVSQVQKAGSTPNLIWVFSGQGSQYPGMGHELINNYPIARDTIERLDRILDGIDPNRGWTLHEKISESNDTSSLSQAEYSQPCCAALQIALVDVLKSLKVKPAAVVGHSSGEIAAAYAVNALSAADAISVAYHRGKVSCRAENDGNGGMAAVGLGRERVSPFLTNGVTIACENSPTNVTISGDSVALEVVTSTIAAHHPDILVRRLRVKCAYHSAQMLDVEDEYRELLRDLKIEDQPLSAVFVSSVTGEPVQSVAEFCPEYWCRNLTSPVLFDSAISHVLSDVQLSHPVFLEIGPHSTLSGPLREIGANTDSKLIPYVPTLIRGSNAHECILRTAGRLFQSNVDIDLSNICHGALLTTLPSYPWHYEGRFWHESRVTRDWRLRQHPQHDLLGFQITDGNDKEPTWRSIIHLENVPWICDHIVLNETVFPAAGYIAMVGEAIRQLTGQSDFTVRNVNILNALIMHEDRSTEVLTQLKPSRITATLNSDWYEFTITSLLDGIWTTNCTGQARGGRDFAIEVPHSAPGPRKVEPSVWYQTMKRFGLNYGSRFQGMQHITASVTDKAATAEVTDSQEPSESLYAMHPSTIDCIFQLFTVAGVQGIARQFGHVNVPTYIDELYIRPPSGPIAAQVSGKETAKGDFHGDAAGFCDSELVFYLRQMRVSLLSDGEEIRGVDPHAGTRLIWQPDIDRVDITRLIRPKEGFSEKHFVIEELALACMIETEAQTRDVTPSLPHYVKFGQWLRMQLERATQGVYDHVPNCQEIAAMSSVERIAHIEKLYLRACDVNIEPVAAAIRDICKHSTALFGGETDALEVLVKNDLLTEIYNQMQICDFTDFFRVLSHNRPRMRVLEIGAGTGGITAMILPALRGPHGERMYDSYTYTDISAGFFNAARERFKDHDSIIYHPLDITVDPLTQGFDAGSYDLIIASNALHVTASLQQSLANVKTLLKPNGKLFLQELAPITKWINYVMATLPGWWLAEADGRPWEPYIASSQWNSELHQAGLSGADAIVHDGHINTHIISSAQPIQPLISKRATVLCRAIKSEAVEVCISLLEADGFVIDIHHLGEELPIDQLIISLLELDEAFVHSLGPEEFICLQDLITSLGSTPLLWITRSAQIACTDPRFAPILGLFRTARMELSVSAITLELDSLDEVSLSTVVTVAERVMRNTLTVSTLDCVCEYACTQGQLMVSKFYPAVISEELLDTKPLEETAPVSLRVGKRGLLQTLTWKPTATRPEDIPEDWVEVQTRVVGLNFKDLLIAMGIVDGSEFGAECAGVVRRVGPGVKNLRVGDRVITFTAGSFTTNLLTIERLCAPMAPGLSWIEAATVPCVFATVLYSLINIARVKHGDSVLIHSACGGIGLAAIQVCRMLGAQIYCTVGSDIKIKYLVDMGIPRDRIFYSRDNSFLRDVLAATGGRGVDVVLNSLSGELLHASWQCVAEFGTMVELGKRDFIGKGQLAMEFFESNRTFAGVDLGQICERRPGITHNLLQRCMAHFSLGELSPLPVQEFTAEHVGQAFRYLQKGTHIGKVAVVMPDKTTTLPIAVSPKTPCFRSDAWHLVIGGLGGLGRSVSSWISLHGGRNFVFFSRSAADHKKDDFVRELEAQGCQVRLVSGNVNDEKDVDSLIDSLDGPISGVLQTSMVLQDRSLLKMSFEDWQVAFLPKVQGTWNLHRSLEKHHRAVDYFVLFSSHSGLFGRSGQANYAAGNTFLDAFVQYRHSLGLPCSAIDIGVIEDVGYVSRNASLLHHFHATSTYVLQEQNVLDTIQLAIDKSLPASKANRGMSEFGLSSYVNDSQICIGLRTEIPLDSPHNRMIWRQDSRLAIYHNLNMANENSRPSADENDNKLQHFLHQARLNPAILAEQHSTDLLTQEIGQTLLSFTLRYHSGVDYEAPLVNLGMDSLIAIELRTWFRTKLSLNLSVLEILGSGSLRKLGEITANYLAVKMTGDSLTGITAIIEDVSER